MAHGENMVWERLLPQYHGRRTDAIFSQGISSCLPPYVDHSAVLTDWDPQGHTCTFICWLVQAVGCSAEVGRSSRRSPEFDCPSKTLQHKSTYIYSRHQHPTKYAPSVLDT